MYRTSYPSRTSLPFPSPFSPSPSPFISVFPLFRTEEGLLIEGKDAKKEIRRRKLITDFMTVFHMTTMVINKIRNPKKKGRVKNENLRRK